jgi:bifunctional DNA-binding transcriptional regulator/antitoxin component of YhaV-PrlF toxin-antitoxin module
MGIAWISAKNQITLPPDILARLHLKPGDQVVLQWQGVQAVMIPLPTTDFLKVARKMAPFFKGVKVDVKKAHAQHIERRFGKVAKA